MQPSEFYSALENGRAGPAYFLHGPDGFMHEECRRAIVTSLPPEAREWCFTEYDFDPSQFQRELENAYQMPMLGGHCFLYWSDPEDFSHATDDNLDALAAYLKRPPGFATILFAACQPDRRRRFIQLLEKKAEVVDVQPPSRQEATEWVKNHVRKAGFEMKPEVAALIVARFEGQSESSGKAKAVGVNLLWLRTEIEKLLVARAGVRRIEELDLEAMVVGRQEHEIGKMLAAIADRRLTQALTLLQELLAGKQPEALILWSIAELFRQALKSVGASTRARHGWSRSSYSFSMFEIAPRAERNYSREELAAVIRHLHAADLAMKSSWKDSRLLLETLLWQIMAGTAGPGSPAWLEEVNPGPLGA